MRILLALPALAAVAAAGPIEDAREWLRKGDVQLATSAVGKLVAADSAEAVKALNQGIETVLTRLDRETIDYLKKTEDWVHLQSKVIEVASKITEMISARKDGTAEFKALLKKRDDLDVKNKRLAAEQKEAGAKIESSDTIAIIALSAFRRFRSDDAVGALEALAGGKAGRVSRACTGAIACIGAERSRPVLAGLSRSRDKEQRILAVRGLRGPGGAAPPELAACLTDKSWEVRGAAYEAAAQASAPVAIALLIEARATAHPDDLPLIDPYLRRLTGVALADAAQWKAWWAENGDAVRGGTFRSKAEGPPPPDDPVTAALARRRLSLVAAAEVRTRDESGKRLTDEPPDLSAAVREVAKRAVAGIAEGATFGLFVPGTGAKPPVRISDASRRALAGQLDELKNGLSGLLFRTVIRLLFKESEGIQYADTLLLVAASNENADPGEVDVLVSRLGELPAAPVIHCVGAGDSYDEYLLASLALQTGGAFAGGEARVYAKMPAPGADRWTAGNVRVAAYRALRGGGNEGEALKALASIGEEAYPLLPMVVPRLDSQSKLEALAVLAAMGPWAREALPRVQSLAGDSSPEVSKAAQAAADRISGK